MKKLAKYLLGTVAFVVTIGGVFYFLKNVINSDTDDDFDDFEEDFDDFDLEEEDTECPSESEETTASDKERSYTTIPINKEEVDTDSEEEE